MTIREKNKTATRVRTCDNIMVNFEVFLNSEVTETLLTADSSTVSGARLSGRVNHLLFVHEHLAISHHLSSSQKAVLGGDGGVVDDTASHIGCLNAHRIRGREVLGDVMQYSHVPQQCLCHFVDNDWMALQYIYMVIM